MARLLCLKQSMLYSQYICITATCACIMTRILLRIGHQIIYHIAGKFGGLAVYITTTKLKSAKVSYSYIYVWRSHTEPPNLNPPILSNSDFGLNRQTANISGHTVMLRCKYSTFHFQFTELSLFIQVTNLVFHP